MEEMEFPDFESTPVGVLTDLEDERRHKKPWLPPSDKDVTEGRVALREYPGLTGFFPACQDHGAILCVAPEGHVWRCGEQRCGVGAIYRRR